MTSSGRRALWVVSVSDMAGVARHVLDVARHGVPGWELSYLLPDGPLAEELRALGCAVESNRFGRAHTLGSASGLRRLIHERSPEIVHSHLAWADVVAAAAKPGRSSARLISTEHGIAPGHLYHHTVAKAASRAVVHRLRLRRTDALIAVSQATARVAEQRWGLPRSGRVAVIPNGVDAAAAQHGEAGVRFGCLARLAPEKDFRTLLDAFELLQPELPGATLDVAGTGPLEGWLATEVDQRALHASVRLRGFMDPHVFFEEVDTVVQLSRWENCSYSVLDAVLHGKGVVATAIGGYLEYLPDRCLVPVGDAAEAAVRMREQSMHTEMRPTLPADWPSVAEMSDRIAAIYDAVVNAPSGAGGGERQLAAAFGRQ